MAKQKSVWFCSDCGQKQLKWLGQCPSCNLWNTFQEEIETSSLPRRFESQPGNASRPVKLNDVKLADTPRILTHIKECDRLIGGGIVPGSLTLVGGDPGIGKSTLLLQLLPRPGKTGTYCPLYLRGGVGRTNFFTGKTAEY